MSIKYLHTLLQMVLFICFLVVELSGTAQAIEIGPPPVIAEGDSQTVIGPHHTPGDGFHDEHYFTMTGDAHHFQWLPGTPGPLTIKYDFRDILGFTNNITSEQIANAVAAFGMWSDATLGNILFVQDTMAPAGDIINVGTGDLAALGSTSGPGGTLGLGGGGFTHGDPLHSITGGVAWQDSAEVWDNQIGNGNPVNTFDYFTVVTQEIGHALGLGHTDNTGPDNMMNGSYTGEKTVLSAVDVDHIKSVYGSATTVVTVPTMSEWGIITLVLTLAGAAFVRIRKLNLTNNVG